MSPVALKPWSSHVSIVAIKLTVEFVLYDEWIPWFHCNCTVILGTIRYKASDSCAAPLLTRAKAWNIHAKIFPSFFGISQHCFQVESFLHCLVLKTTILLNKICQTLPNNINTQLEISSKGYIKVCAIRIDTHCTYNTIYTSIISDQQAGTWRTSSIIHN